MQDARRWVANLLREAAEKDAREGYCPADSTPASRAVAIWCRHICCKTVHRYIDDQLSWLRDQQESTPSTAIAGEIADWDGALNWFLGHYTDRIPSPLRLRVEWNESGVTPGWHVEVLRDDPQGRLVTLTDSHREPFPYPVDVGRFGRSDQDELAQQLMNVFVGAYCCGLDREAFLNQMFTQYEEELPRKRSGSP